MEQSNAPRIRPSRACEVCHEKKIRCDLVGGSPCSRCRVENIACRPHQRQRKRRRSRSPEGNARSKGARNVSSVEGNEQDPLPAQCQKDVTPSSCRPSPQVPSRADIPSGNQPVNQPDGSTDAFEKKDQPFAEQQCPGTQGGYLGRSEYFGLGASQLNERTDVGQSDGFSHLSKEEAAVLEVHRAFDLPPLAVRRSLIDSFFTYCTPWMPIVERSFLRESGPKAPSILLLQSVFLAGSRVATASHVSGSSATYYRRAKALFFSNYEKNPITKIIAACLLNWWNPSGPEEISLDGSSFWLRVAVNLAHQIGLHKEPRDGTNASYRRRLWWSLVARDCQISACHGRPRAIDLADSDVSPPSPRDFPDHDQYAELFTAYVKISMILGECTQSYLRHQLSQPRRQQIRNALYCWVNELPRQLCLRSPQPGQQANTYDMHTRCLHVPYFVILTILYRPVLSQETPTTIAAIASSFLTGIYEEFLARDEFRFLAPTYKFYLFAAGMAQVHTQAFLSPPSEIIEQEFGIVKSSLEALATRWPSATSNIHSLQTASQSISSPARKPTLVPLPSHHEAYPLLHNFGPDLCRMWHLIDPKHKDLNNVSTDEIRWQGTTGTEDLPRVSGDHVSQAASPVLNYPLIHPATNLAPTFSLNPTSALEPPTTDCHMDDDTALWNWPMFELSGNWLLDELPGMPGG